MIHINGYQIQLILNNYEYTIGDISLESITIYESVQLNIPTVEIVCSVPDIKSVQFLSSDNIRGKLNISRVVNNNIINIVDIPIRLFSPKGYSDVRNNNLLLTFNYDWDFAYDASTRAITGTSSNVFRSLGVEQRCKTTYISQTLDTMTWINPNQRGLIFLQNVCEHAWSSSSSCFCWCIRADNSMVFRDISSKGNESLSKKINLVTGKENVIINYGIDSNLMILNRAYGYGRTSYIYNYEKNIQSELPKIALRIEGTHPLVSSSTPQGTFRSPEFYGNTHEHYQQAALQNIRIRSTYNTNISGGFLNDNTSVNLLDDVVIVNNSSNYSVLNNLKGIVSKRIMRLTNNSMKYNIEIDTNAFNSGNL